MEETNRTAGVGTACGYEEEHAHGRAATEADGRDERKNGREEPDRAELNPPTGQKHTQENERSSGPLYPLPLFHEASISHGGFCVCAHQPEDKGKGSRKTQTRVGAIHGQVASPPLFHYVWESISSINQPAHEEWLGWREDRGVVDLATAESSH